MESGIMICSFCLRPMSLSESENSDRHNDNQLVLKRFEKILDHFLGTGFPSNLNAGGEQKCVIETCLDCMFLVKGFCNLYHEWKRLELELNWKLRRLRNVMKSANKVQSRRQAFEANLSSCVVNKIKHFELISSFRKEFQLKCHKHLSNTFPKVVLKRLKDSPTSSGITDASRDDLKVNPDGEVSNHLFLGWVSTYVAVLTLALFGRWFETHQRIKWEGDVHEKFAPLEDSLSETTPCGLYEMERSAADSTAVHQDFREVVHTKKVKTQNKKRKKAQRIHKVNEQRKYGCVSCNRKFVNGNSLRKHRRSFTHILRQKKLANFHRLQMKRRVQKLHQNPISKQFGRLEVPVNNVDKIKSESYENVGVLRPLRATKRKLVNKSDDDLSSDSSDNKFASDDYEEDSLESDSSSISSESSSNVSNSSLSSQCTEKSKVTKFPFACNLDTCSESFRFEEELKLHNKFHGSYSCASCDFFAAYAPDLARHELEHSDNSNSIEIKNMKRQCPRCDYASYGMYDFVNHFLVEHLSLPSQKRMCPDCKKWLSGSGLKGHIRTHHGPGSRYKCDKCQSFFLKKKQLTVHQSMAKHKTISEENTTKLDKKRKVAPKMFSCEVNSCATNFDFKEELEIHKTYHGSFSCQFCEAVKSYAPDLATHEAKTHSTSKAKTLKEWQCSRCEYKTKLEYCLVNHFLQKHLGISKQLVVCRTCKAMVGPDALSYHFKCFHSMKNVDPKTVHNCDECSAYFLKKSQLVSHLQTIHTESGDALRSRFVQKCNINTDCDRRFETTKEKLENRTKLHGKFACSQCDVVEKFAPKLALHELIHTPPSSGHPKSSGNRKRVCCPKCKSLHSSEFRYINHFLKAHMSLPPKGVACPNCKDTFRSKSALKIHSKSFHNFDGVRDEDIAKCDECSATFGKPFHLILHKEVMHGKVEDALTCEDCGKKYDIPSRLRVHRQVKHKKKEADFPWACDVPNCERKFEKQIGLEWHKQNTHHSKSTEDGCFVCHECGKKCANESGLLNHIRVHGPPAPVKKRVPERYVCEECGKVFKNNHYLATHQLSHSGPAGWKYACLFCGKKSSTEYNLYIHMMVHTKEKPYFCDICEEEYTQPHHLRNHKNSKHGTNEHPQPYKLVNVKESRKGLKAPRWWKKQT